MYKRQLEGVINARAKASQPIIQAGDGMTQEQLNQFQQAQGDLTSALSKLMVVVERYPELKADENFRQLQAQLVGTENRITTARMDFNNEAQQYNTKVRRFPTNIFAGLFGFHPVSYTHLLRNLSHNAPSSSVKRYSRLRATISQ